LQDWLYDEGEDESKSVYSQKLEELLRLGSPLEQREKEDRLRPTAAAALMAVATHFNSLAASEDPKYFHISAEDRTKVRGHPSSPRYAISLAVINPSAYAVSTELHTEGAWLLAEELCSQSPTQRVRGC